LLNTGLSTLHCYLAVYVIQNFIKVLIFLNNFDSTSHQ